MSMRNVSSLRPWTHDRASYLERSATLIASHEPDVRAFTAINIESAVNAEVDSGAPLAGMPFAVKEIIDVAGWPVTFGSSTMTDRVASHDAEAVRKLREAGAVVMGIATSTPFACGMTTVTANPAGLDHTPGGSSAGSGAAVAAGYVPVALGSQSQASTLRPASYCGTWGFKPSHGRLPTAGMHRLADSLDDLGLLAASLDDLMAVFDVLAEPRRDGLYAAPQGLRIGVLRLDHGGLVGLSTMQQFDRLIALLRQSDEVNVDALGADLKAMDDALAGSGQSCFDIFAGEAAAVLEHLVAAGEPDQRLREMVDHASQIGPDGLAKAYAHRDALWRQWHELAKHYDLFIALTTTNPAPLGHDATGCRRLPATSSLLGIPAISAPWLTVDGLPQGAQLLGFSGKDEDLLQAAKLLHTIVTRNEEIR